MTDNIKSFPIRDTLVGSHTAARHTIMMMMASDIDLNLTCFRACVFVVALSALLCVALCVLFILIIPPFSSLNSLWAVVLAHLTLPTSVPCACRKLQMIQTLCHSQQTLIIYKSEHEREKIAERAHAGSHSTEQDSTRQTCIRNVPECGKRWKKLFWTVSTCFCWLKNMETQLVVELCVGGNCKQQYKTKLMNLRFLIFARSQFSYQQARQ